jgi:hypothetical protein
VSFHLWCSWLSSKPQVVDIQLGPQGRRPPSVVSCWSFVMVCSLLGVSGKLVFSGLLVLSLSLVSRVVALGLAGSLLGVEPSWYWS